MLDIGKKIEEVFNRSGMTKTAFADKIGFSRNNVYNIFNRKTIDLNLLKKIGKVLQYDFVSEYRLEQPLIQNVIVEEANTVYKPKKKTTKISLLIEIDPDDDLLMNEAFSKKLKELMKVVSQ